MSREDLTNELIEIAIREDIGSGDHTTLSTLKDEKQGKARLIAKENGIICGTKLAERIFLRADKQLETKILIQDGSGVHPGNLVLTVSGNTRSILTAERLVLNFMQRLSAVATRTNQYMQELKGLKTKVIDTRKTTPGMRALEKYAVRCGGGANHRMGLYDMILIKDNHIDFAGGIKQAIYGTKQYLEDNGLTLKIEIETRSIADVKEVLEIGGVDRIMLDNFKIEDTMEAVKLINGVTETESSGGITLETVRAYAECGVDYISVGDLTHHISSLDLSLKAE